MTRTTHLILCALGALALATVASGAASETGVTSTQVLIGGTTPLSGPASAYQSVAKGAAAYFRYVNANGGVNKRKIKYVYKDDAYDPSKTADKTRELVQQDKVFAIFNSLGTEQNLATRAYLNAIKIPQLFVASGATTFGKDYKQYPWTIGYQPNYRAEGHDLRALRREDRPEGAHRRPLPERRLRQGPARRPAQRPRQEGEADRLQAELRRRPIRTCSRRSPG